MTLLLFSKKINLIYNNRCSWLFKALNRSMGTTSESPVDLQELTKEELISKIIKLQKHVANLHLNIKNQSTSPLEYIGNKKSVDFTIFKQRRIALRLMYLGWNYHGLAIQANTCESIENYLFTALERTKLIRDRREANFQKTGRTDKKVSAFCQIVSINVRTSAKEGIGVFEPADYREINKFERGPMNYCGMLNKVLPDDIQVIAWSPVQLDFNARFGCESRTYRYFFPANNLDIGRMRAAAYSFIGVHKMTNFCKKSRKKDTPNLHRSIYSVSIFPLHPQLEQDHPLQLFVIEITASGFLWHQIRCMMTILFYVAKGQEEPSIIKKLLNTVQVKKPQYEFASGLPLCLYNATFKEQTFQWNFDEKVMRKTLSKLQKIASENLIKSQMTHSMIKDIAKEFQQDIPANNDWVVEEKRKTHKSLLTRKNDHESWPEDGNFFEDDFEAEREKNEDFLQN